MSDDLTTQVAASLRELQSNQVRILTGTVVGTSPNAQTIPVRLDNDGSDIGTPPVIIPSICGLLDVNTRVSIATVPPAGMIIIGEIGATYNVQDLWDYFISMTGNVVWMDRRFYTTPGVTVWNKPTSALFMGVQVCLQAGGGASGGTAACPATDTSCSGPGQGGGYAEWLILAQNLTATVNVTVGAGGTVGAAGNVGGNDGGTSSFGAYAAVLGGEGGAGGGTAAAGQTFQNGGNNDQFGTLTTAGGAVLLDFQQGDDGALGFRFANTMIYPGAGGGCRMGGITRAANITAGQIPPVSGWPFGGGASGRGVNGPIVGGGGTAASTGAPGAQGCAIVKEFYRT